MTFFVPHTVFRMASLAIVAAFFRLYALIPLSIFVFVIICLLTRTRPLPLYIFTPAVLNPFDKDFRKLLKRTMLLSTLFLLPCLLLIRLLPLLPPSTIHCTLGLSHININSEDIPPCSPCFFNHTADDNVTSGNNISANNFARLGK